MICHIAALSKNRVIGNKGDLPWRLPEDLKYFKATTLNHCLIMGRKTFESLGRPLPQRTNVVVTKDPNWKADGCEVFNSIDAALEFCKEKSSNENIFIAGGGEIFKQTLPVAEKLYLTLIDTEIDGDAFYPDWSEDFKMTSETPQENEKFKYSFCIFERNTNSIK